MKQRALLAGVILALAAATVALAQTGEGSATQDPTTSSESIAATFFIIRVTHANGEQTIDLVGSALVWLLLALSVVNIGLIGFLAMTNQRKDIVPEGVMNEARRLVNSGQVRQAQDLTRKDSSFFSRVLHRGLNEASHGFASAIRALEQAADVEIARRMRPIEILYMFGMVSPMMGLLGTVYGIIFAFRVFVSMGGRASPALLAGGIGTALIATFWGLVVAIPALAAYSMLRNKVDQLTMEAMTAAEEMLNHFRSKSPAAAKPAPAKSPTAV